MARGKYLWIIGVDILEGVPVCRAWRTLVLPSRMSDHQMRDRSMSEAISDEPISERVAFLGVFAVRVLLAGSTAHGLNPLGA